MSRVVKGAEKDEMLGGKTKQQDFKDRSLPRCLHICTDSCGNRHGVRSGLSGEPQSAL